MHQRMECSDALQYSMSASVSKMMLLCKACSSNATGLTYTLKTTHTLFNDFCRTYPSSANLSAGCHNDFALASCTLHQIWQQLLKAFFSTASPDLVSAEHFEITEGSPADLSAVVSFAGQERERRGGCLAGLALMSHQSPTDTKGLHRYTFVRLPPPEVAGMSHAPASLADCGFAQGEMVLLGLDGEFPILASMLDGIHTACVANSSPQPSLGQSAVVHSHNCIGCRPNFGDTLYRQCSLPAKDSTTAASNLDFCQYSGALSAGSMSLMLPLLSALSALLSI